MRVGSHSLDHVILANEAPAEQHRNLCESRRALESHLDVEITLLAYPNGGADDFDAVTGMRRATPAIAPRSPPSPAATPRQRHRFACGASWSARSGASSGCARW
jgi:peptidoglycan/xylan/chitin deacetylase (PgdA/CDA1 family)